MKSGLVTVNARTLAAETRTLASALAMSRGCGRAST